MGGGGKEQRERQTENEINRPTQIQRQELKQISISDYLLRERHVGKEKGERRLAKAPWRSCRWGQSLWSWPLRDSARGNAITYQEDLPESKRHRTL